MSKNSTTKNDAIFMNLDAQIELEFWSNATNWKVTDMIEFLKLVNISLPITMNYDKKSDKFICLDSNKKPFNIILHYTIDSCSSFLTVEYEDKSFTYLIDRITKNFKYKDKISLYGTTVKNSKNNNTLYSTKDEKNIHKKLYVNDSDEYIYDIQINLTNKNESTLLEGINNNSNLFDQYLLNLNINLPLTKIMSKMIEELELSDLKLESLNITATIMYKDMIIEKIYLEKNVLVELKFSTSMFYFDIFSSGECTILSKDDVLKSTIKNIYEFKGDYYTINDYYANDIPLMKFQCSISSLKKIFETISKKEWIEPSEILLGDINK